ncbi:MAG: hypothetical protein IKF17_01925 [Clostridia bacterium]|nr:hypothetical protein [Clostridia bacterium]
MFKRFCKVMILEFSVILSLCTCTLPTKAYAEGNSTIDVITHKLMVISSKIIVGQAEEIRTFYEQQQAKQQEEEAKLAEEEQQAMEEDVEETEAYQWTGEVLNSFNGVANGPSGYETYYNLPMGGVVSIMRGLGYDEASYPYWVRDDGVKMLGDYVMCAANLDIRPYGTILPSSLGMAIVCDTGDFAYSNPYQLDIAVSW